ncbi:MAG: TolC family protein, partial [Burkholderiaceae bacterium]
ASIGAALAATENARSALALANERAALSSQAHALIAKSYRLGESDLPTRLRFEADKFDADLALARAIADAQRAVSRLNQAYGLLP